MGATALADYAALLERWATVFGRKTWSSAASSPPILSTAICSRILPRASGSKIRSLFPCRATINRSTPESLIFLRAINRRTPRRLAERMGALRSAAVAILQQRHGGTKFVISQELASRIEARFRTSNERVAAEYFGSRFQPLFSPPTLVGEAARLPPNSISFPMAIWLSLLWRSD